MKLVGGLLLLVAILHCSYAPPVTQQKKGSNEQDSEIKDDLEEYMEYHRYLKEVVQALESDSDFREKLEKAEESDIRDGKIADQLDFVNHNVRTQLDEIKRREMERLRHLATREYELTNNIDTNLSKVPSSSHLDHNNPHTFEIEDLKRLIKQTTSDLTEADRKRREEFKEYEMQKEFQKNQKLESLDETQKKEFEEKLKQEEKLQKQHPPLHHPVTREQLLEVWKKEDHLEAKDFNPKVFFVMHDVDGNGVWDADEVKALFVKELDKMYKQGGSRTDLRERREEMERMREHVFRESDTNRDGLIDYNEFLVQTKQADFEQDPGWKGIDENQVYTQQEYAEFEKRRMEEIRYLQERGMLDAQGRPIPGAYQQQHPQYQQQYQPLPPQYQTQYYQQHPNEIPQQYNHPMQGQVPQQPQHHGQMPLHQPPQGYVGQGQMPQYGQMPQHGQMSHHDQMPQHGQIPQQGQMPQHGQKLQQGQMPQHGQQQGHIPRQGQMPQQGHLPQQVQAPQQPPQPGQLSQQGQVAPQAQAHQQPAPQVQGQNVPNQNPSQQLEQQHKSSPQGVQSQDQTQQLGQPAQHAQGKPTDNINAPHISS